MAGKKRESRWISSARQFSEIASSRSNELMAEELRSVQKALEEALSLSQQGSYQRRAPADRAVPLLNDVKERLERWIEENGESLEALRALAVCQEALLLYGDAIATLERILVLFSPPDRKDLKRLAACREADVMWRALMLTPQELVALGDFLNQKLMDIGPAQSFQWTEQWLLEHRPQENEVILNGMRRLGHFCDYEVLHNLVAG
jgi:tetratricopeptide (TPR) repeat protein